MLPVINVFLKSFSQNIAFFCLIFVIKRVWSSKLGTHKAMNERFSFCSKEHISQFVRIQHTSFIYYTHSCICHQKKQTKNKNRLPRSQLGNSISNPSQTFGVDLQPKSQVLTVTSSRENDHLLFCWPLVTRDLCLPISIEECQQLKKH